jgi:hypothetical protein
MATLTEEMIETGVDKDFSKFGQKFQLATLNLLIQDKSFANKIKLIIKPEYFDNKYNQFLCQTIVTFIENYHCQPDFETLKTIIETQVGAGTKLYLLALDSIKNVDLSKKEFVEAECAKFCFTRHALSSLEEERANILLGKFDKAREVAFQKYKPMSSASSEVDLKKDYAKALSSASRNPVPTPLPSMNAVSKGGPGAGDLCVIVAQSNFGKTNYLVATAKHAAQVGKKVLFFSLETDNIQLMQRILAGISNVNQESLSDHPSLIEGKLKGLAGELKFIEMKSIQARVDAIKAIVEEKKSEGFFPDIIIVDGLNQVKPPRTERFANANDKFEYLAEEMRDMAKELRLPVYVAFQSNRGGFNVEMADEQNIGKAIEVYQVCDWMLLFTQSLPMQDAGECYVQLLKNRLGPKGMMLKLRYDPNKVMFQELESVNRSLLMDKSRREGVTKGLDTMAARLADFRKKGT